MNPYSEEQRPRLDAEWVSINAIRGMLQIASRGDATVATYDNAIAFGEKLIPGLLATEHSLLRHRKESHIAREFRQKAQLISLKGNIKTTAIDVLLEEKQNLEDLLLVAKNNRTKSSEQDRIRRRLQLVLMAERELNLLKHTENQLIFRDAYNADPRIPTGYTGKQFKDYALPDDRIIRVRVLHPEVQEIISGADIIYERHRPNDGAAEIVAIQYKIWKSQCLNINEPRLNGQVSRMRKYLCDNGYCINSGASEEYRFPYCCAFLRPTDHLQNPEQRLMSTGEHIPICKLESYSDDAGPHRYIHIDGIKDIALNADAFQLLFASGKIGSRTLSYAELEDFHREIKIDSHNDNLTLHLQEFEYDVEN